MVRLPKYVTLLVSVAVVAATGWFVAGRLSSQWDEASDAVGRAAWGWAAVAVVLAGAGVVSVALGWRRVLAAMHFHVRAGRVVAWFFAGEIGKYVPGGVWPVVGRAELAVRGGVPRTAAYRSVAWSLGCVYAASTWLGPLAVALGGPRLRRWAAVTLWYLPSWLLIGSATWAVARALDAGAPWAGVVAVTSLSWLAGFVALPAPGGLGVREAAFTFLAADLLDPGVAAATAVTARLVFVTVDAAGAALALPLVGAREAAP